MTVSRVINGEKNVKESTREAVLAAVEKLNYSPNLAARSLAGSEQIRIGLIYSNPSAAYLSRFLLGSLEQARVNQVQLSIEKCDYDERDEETALREMIATGVDGIIISPPLCDSERLLSLLAEADVLAVAVANWQIPHDISVVRIDDRAAAHVMTQHLVSLGHSRIAFISASPEQKASEQRLLGYRDAMAAAGIAVDEALVVQGAFSYRSGFAPTEQLLDLPVRPTAIFAGNDDMAAAAVAAAHRRHLIVPEDLTVCGFDDSDFAQSIWPELTTIHQPIAAMARAAIDVLVENIRGQRAGRAVPKREVLLDYTLVKRDSDAPLLLG